MPAILPEDLSDFAWIARSDRPLIVCDVDEVALEFVSPFIAYLEANGMELRPTSFRLHGNVFSRESGAVVERERVAQTIQSFFTEQDRWQRPVTDAAESLAALEEHADIVFMTAMPPVHFATRRSLLDAHGMPYPMIATEDAKGTVLHLIHGDRQTPVVFIDDIFTNLHSVRDKLPNALLVHLMANRQFRALAPHPGDNVATPADWREARDIIRAFLDEGRDDSGGPT